MTLANNPSQRFKYIFLGILCLLILCTPVSAGLFNIIPNGNFDDLSDHWTLHQDPPSAVAIAYGYGVGGGNGVKYNGGGTTNTRYVYIQTESLDFTLGNGTVYFDFYTPDGNNFYIYKDSDSGELSYLFKGTSNFGFTTGSCSVPTSGTHTLKFQVKYLSGSGDVYLDNINVGNVIPTASFAATSATSGVIPLTVDFASSDTGTTNYYWDYGDGGGLIEGSSTASHQYTTEGVYSVSHRANNMYAATWYNRTNYIYANATPTASFYADTTSGISPLTVTFTRTTTGGGLSYNWTFGDGGQNISSINPVIHTYNTAGSYSVNLVVTNINGTASQLRNNYIVVNSAVPHAGMAIGGTITNSAGGTISGATITLTNKTVSWTSTTTTDSLGTYVFNNLSLSTSTQYTVQASKSGFYDSTYLDPGFSPAPEFTFTNAEINNSYKTVSFSMVAIGSSSDTTAGVGGRYAPHLVRFTVRQWYGEPISGVAVTATGMSTTAGNWSLLSALFSFDFTATPIQNSTMTGVTGSDGAVSFWMVENVLYDVIFNGNGVNGILQVYPKNDEYPYIHFGSVAANNYDYQTFSVTSGAYNSTHSYINTNYTDSSGQTNPSKLWIYNGTSKLQVYSASTITTPNNFNNTFYPITHAGDSYIVTMQSTSTQFGVRNYTSVVTIPGRILDLKLANTDYYSWIALALIYLIAQLGGAYRVRDVAVITSIFALFLAWIGWLPTSTLLLQAVIVFAVLYYTRKGEER